MKNILHAELPQVKLSLPLSAQCIINFFLKRLKLIMLFSVEEKGPLICFVTVKDFLLGGKGLNLSSIFHKRVIYSYHYREGKG